MTDRNNFERSRIPKVSRGRGERRHDVSSYRPSYGYESNGGSSSSSRFERPGLSRNHEPRSRDSSHSRFERRGSSRDHEPKSRDSSYSRYERPGNSRDHEPKSRDSSHSRFKIPGSSRNPEEPRSRDSSNSRFERPGNSRDSYQERRRDNSYSRSGPSREGENSLNRSNQRAAANGQFINNKRRRDSTESLNSSCSSQFSRGGRGRGRGRGQFHKRPKTFNRKAERKTYDNVKTKPDDLVKQGSIGQQVMLSANYFKLRKLPEFAMAQYCVVFEPELESKFIKRTILRKISDNLGGYLFDGGNLFLTKKFKNDEATFSVSNGNEEQIIKIKKTRNIDTLDDQAFQLFNIILREAMRGLHLELIGRNFFDPKGERPDLSGLNGLDLWPGYVTSVRQHEGDILLCTDIIHKVMRTQTLHNILEECVRNPGYRGDYQETFKKKVIGTTVLTSYNNKTYKISDVDFDQNVSNEFDYRESKKSYINYYLEKYNIKIVDRRQPILVAKPSSKDIRGGRLELISLIPELCYCTGLSDDMRKNARDMMKLANAMRMNPEKRVKGLLEFSARVRNAVVDNSAMVKFNLEFEDSLIKFMGHRIGEQKVLLGQNMHLRGAEWGNAFVTKTMYSCVQLKNWSAICERQNEREVDSFLNALMQVADKMGFRIQQPRKFVLKNGKTYDYLDAISRAGDSELFFFAIPKFSADLYKALKVECSLQRQTCSQVIQMNTMRRNQKSVATKVAVQINAKLGGCPWMIEIPEKKMMSVGYDVSRDAKQKQKTYGALVATMDLGNRAEKVKFFSTVSEHQNGSETSNNMNINFIKALKAYTEMNGYKPEKIILYRDGVGDGQVQYVVETEVNSILNVLKQFYGDNMPEFGFIIINKRTNTRIFQGTRNPEPGTVADDTITMKERYDFYLVSTSDNRSTVAPTYYNVVHSNLKMTPDQLQELTYKFCHFYYNWNGTIRVPAVCRLAQKLAFLVTQSLHTSIEGSLSNKLHYL